MARVNLDETDSPDELDEPEATSGRKPPTPPETEKPEAKKTPAAAPVPRGQVAGKEKLQPYITKDVAEAARDAVVWTTPHEGGYQSLSELIEDAIKEKVAKLQRKYNNGEPFPPRPRKEIRTGRPPRR
ncbi:hypothetical protein OG762_52260 (plasmid) [Streptomyces sp. NBC_01136]|uniref:ParB family protein n=1 Tax=unclassified Streptomyces TaxID=2593676 RepID=UPI002F916B9F|nr:hypothetical protein OG762_52260 [Streptomyces sp. NBC_01136]